eukprot:TRINITY_DN8630_c0_g1_i7.p1 TRINITY_DN8630_c0_g1~~TRINITY_DN8630_c0_g1_i7.p1  ORF type:complete len:592 (+),score=96.58 TRINITY_DN8630_c0_g1_i7:260-2035(+)
MATADGGRLTLLASSPQDSNYRKPQYERITPEPDCENQHEPKLRANSEAKNFFEEHWGRCPKRAQGKSSMTNLGGLLLEPLGIGLKIFIVERSLTAYDFSADIVVMSKIDRGEDPWWFRISIGLIVLPIILKVFLFRKTFIDMLKQSGFGAVVAWAFYLTIGVIAMMLSDYILLFLYPWVRPSPGNYGFLLQFERLSGLIEGLIEGASQWLWQIYMWVRVKQLGRHTQASLQGFLLFSIIPGMASLAYKLYTLNKEAQQLNLQLIPYVLELVKAPLGLGRAPFLELLTTLPEVSYEGLGRLTSEHQTAIFEAIGSGEGLTLSGLSFDDSNDIDFAKSAPLVRRNRSLETLTFGSSVTFEDVIVMLTHLQDHKLTLVMGRLEMTQAYRKHWLHQARPLLPRSYPESQGPWNVSDYFEHRRQLDELSQTTGCKRPHFLDDSSLLGKCTLCGEKMSGLVKYDCCVQAPDGIIYAMPFDAEQVLAFDPKTQSTQLVGEKMSVVGKYGCCVQAPDGIIYAMPFDAEQVLAFDPKTQSTQLVGEKMSGRGKYDCCVQAPDGIIYAMPRSAEQVLAFNSRPKFEMMTDEPMDIHGHTL